MATTEASTTLNSRFMTLPGELRNIIYRMLMTNRYAYREDLLKYGPLHIAILRCNRQVHREAMQILHGENIWIIAKVDARHWPSGLGVMRHLSRKGTDAIQYPALRIDLSMPLAENAPPQEHITLLMAETSIPIFIQHLWRISYDENTEQDFRTMSLSLSLCETPFHAKSKLQSRCLEPFGRIHGLQNLSIRGQVDPACVEKIMAYNESGQKDMLQILHHTNVSIERGSEAYFAGESMIASIRYTYGADYLKHLLALRPGEAQTAGARTKDNDFLTMLLFKFDLHIIRASLQMGEYVDVLSTGASMLTDPLLPIDVGVHVRLCVARAHGALDEREQESRLFDEALDAMSDKSTFMEALASLIVHPPIHSSDILLGEASKARRGEAINLDIIKMFWKTL